MQIVRLIDTIVILKPFDLNSWKKKRDYEQL